MLALLRQGLTNEQIAERLGISFAGAKYHVSEILSKLYVSSRDEAALWRPRERVFGLALLAVSLKKLSPEGIMSFTAKAILAAGVSVIAVIAIGAGIMALRDDSAGVPYGGAAQDSAAADTSAPGASPGPARSVPSLEAFDKVTSYRAVIRYEEGVGPLRPVPSAPLDVVAEIEGRNIHARFSSPQFGDVEYIKFGPTDYTRVGQAWTSELMTGVDYATLRQADIRAILNLLTLIPVGQTDMVEGKTCELFDGIPFQAGEGGARYSLCIADDLPLRLVAQAFQTRTVITLTSFNEKFDIQVPIQ